LKDLFIAKSFSGEKDIEIQPGFKPGSSEFWLDLNVFFQPSYWVCSFPFTHTCKTNSIACSERTAHLYVCMSKRVGCLL